MLLNNAVEDRLITVASNTDEGDAEQNLTFDGNILEVTGKVSIIGTSGTSGFVQMSQRDNVTQNNPVLSAGETALFSSSSGAGGTGIYFRQGTNNSDELVSRKKAITYGLIF